MCVFVIAITGVPCIVHVISFQKMYGLYGLKHHKVEKSLNFTTDDGNLKIELEFCEAEFAITLGSKTKH